KQDEKQKGDKSDQAQNQKDKSGEKGDEKDAEPQQVASLGALTPEQAMQLLDAQKNEERALIFIPPPKPESQKQRNLPLKDW
ncbi:MAG: aerotolerance protein, partial [Verrucomicrobiota bacterium]